MAPTIHGARGGVGSLRDRTDPSNFPPHLLQCMELKV